MCITHSPKWVTLSRYSGQKRIPTPADTGAHIATFKWTQMICHLTHSRGSDSTAGCSLHLQTQIPRHAADLIPFTHILLSIQWEVGKSKSLYCFTGLQHLYPDLYQVTHFFLCSPSKQYMKQHWTFKNCTFRAARFAPGREQKPLKST